MALTDTAVAIEAAKRLKWPPSKTLALQSMIPAALSNLAKAVARDPMRRHLLMTDPAVVQATVTPGNQVSVVSPAVTGSADLSEIVETYGVMLDDLQYGTVFHQYVIPFTSGDVTATAAWPDGSYITLTGLIAAILTEGLPVYLETSGALPSGVSPNVTYYMLQEDDTTFGLAISLAAVATNTGVTFSNVGSGNSAIYSAKTLLQWLKSPNQGFAETCLPFSMLQGWLEGYDLKVKGVPFISTYSVLSFNVPYMPKTLADLPAGDDLHQDLIDTLVAIAMTGGTEDVPPME